MNMQKYDQILAVLGQDDKSPAFAQLIKGLKEAPNKLLESAKSTEYLFPKAGIAFSLMQSSGHFEYAFLHLSSPLVKSGNIEAYQGKLPNDVEPEDTRDVVRSKVRADPLNCKPANTDAYRATSLVMTFIFNDEDNKHCLVGLQTTFR